MAGSIIKRVMSIEQIENFWAYVDIKDTTRECWNWTGAKKSKGYGNIRINCNYMLAHRVAFELAVTGIPDGLIVLHLCDNPSCCNPAHLVLGTIKANSVDMLIKGRDGFKKNRAAGMRNANSKLTDDKVRQIRSEYSSGKGNQYELADKYGVSQHAIASVVNNKTWRHVN